MSKVDYLCLIDGLTDVNILSLQLIKQNYGVGYIF